MAIRNIRAVVSLEVGTRGGAQHTYIGEKTLNTRVVVEPGMGNRYNTRVVAQARGL